MKKYIGNVQIVLCNSYENITFHKEPGVKISL